MKKAAKILGTLAAVGVGAVAATAVITKLIKDNEDRYPLWCCGCNEFGKCSNDDDDECDGEEF